MENIFEQKLAKIKIIGCKTLEDEILVLKPDNMTAIFLEYALHNTPEKLTLELQKIIDTETEADILIFAYGLCSNGLVGLKSRDKTLVIPKVHDCISLLLGSSQKYLEEFNRNPGTYYLSKGWIKQEGDPYAEYTKLLEKYSEKKAKWIMQQQYGSYTRLVFIDTALPNLSEFEAYAKKVAGFMKLNYCKIKGENKFFVNLLTENWNENFIRVPPGRVVKLEDFIE